MRSNYKMIAFTAIWLLLGLIAILVLLALAIQKKFKWNFFGLALAIYLLLSFIFLVVAGSPSSTNFAKESNQSSQQSTARIFKLIYSDDDDYNGEIHFDSNKDGKYTVKIKGLQNGKVKLKNADDSQEKFKTQTFNIKKGQTLRIPIILKGDDLVHDFELEDSNDNTKDFSIYNNSDTANSIADSISESDKEDNSNNSEGKSSTETNKKYKNGKDVANAINDAAANDPRLNGLHVTYKDSIFYVNIPTEITQTDDNTQKSVYRHVARTIHSYQKSPTGVIYFEDEEGNIVATTKVLNNNDVKLK